MIICGAPLVGRGPMNVIKPSGNGIHLISVILSEAKDLIAMSTQGLSKRR
jgi:hypothetical protein